MFFVSLLERADSSSERVFELTGLPSSATPLIKVLSEAPLSPEPLVSRLRWSRRDSVCQRMSALLGLRPRADLDPRPAECRPARRILRTGSGKALRHKERARRAVTPPSH